jgi:hypothetical protein
MWYEGQAGHYNGNAKTSKEVFHRISDLPHKGKNVAASE